MHNVVVEYVEVLVLRSVSSAFTNSNYNVIQEDFSNVNSIKHFISY